MKIILILFTFFLINQVYSTKIFEAYGLWNENGDATIGVIDLPTGETKTLASIPGYLHFDSNQFSTYNGHTHIISFLVYSNSSDNYYFYQYDIHHQKLDQVDIDLNGISKIYSIASSNNTNEETDLFFVYETMGGDTVLGKLNESTHSISNEMKLPGSYYTAAYDSTNNFYYALSIVNQVYTLNVISRDGSYSNGIVSLKFQNQKQYNITSTPYGMVYLETFDTIYFYLDVNGEPTLFTIMNSVIYELAPNSQYIFTNKKAYSMASSNLVKDNEFFQVVEIKHNNYAGNALINTYNSQSQYVNSYPTETLPINMWITH